MEEEVEAVSMEYLLEQVTQKDLGKRLQVGQEVMELILDEERSPELEQDQSMLDRMVDCVASSWVNSSNFKVSSSSWRVRWGKKKKKIPVLTSVSVLVNTALQPQLLQYRGSGAFI